MLQELPIRDAAHSEVRKSWGLALAKIKATRKHDALIGTPDGDENSGGQGGPSCFSTRNAILGEPSGRLSA